jgi:hypothetical protein
MEDKMTHPTPSSERDAIALKDTIIDILVEQSNDTEKCADEILAIIAARAPSPSSAELIEQCAKVAEDFTTVAHIAYDIKTKVFPSRTSLNVVIANAIRALDATPEMPAPADAWQHIETAPRDGTPFLCFRPDAKFSAQSEIDLIWYEPSIKTYTMDGDNEVPFAGITHWMPLPMAPFHYGKTK